MPADRPPRNRPPPGPPDNADTPTMLPRIVSAVLVVASVIAVFGFSAITGRMLGLPEKMTAAIIALGAIAGLLHLFGVVPQQRQLRAFASPIVAWPVMAAGIATLLTS